MTTVADRHAEGPPGLGVSTPSAERPARARASQRRTRPGRHGSAELSDGLDAAAVGWLVAAAATVAGGLSLWPGADRWSWVGPAALAIIASALATATATVLQRRLGTGGQLLLVVAAAAVIAVRSALAIAGAPAYGSDEAAFDQYAAQLLLHGIDPYGRSLAPALQFFHVPDGARTYLLSGRLVTSLSYPALAFLALVPAVALGVHTQAAIGLDVAAWIAAMVVGWRLLGRSAQWAVVPVALGGVALGYVVSGLNDPFDVVLLLGALWRWDRCVMPGPWWQRWASPVALGLACAVKQTPWFVVPLLTGAVACEAKSHGGGAGRAAAQYLAGVAGAFALPNLPFVLWHPAAWLHGILVPLRDPTVPGGQGLVGLLLATLGGRLAPLDIAGALGLVAMVAAVVAWYPATRRALVLLVAVVLVLPERSFGSYILLLVPAVLVGASSLGPAGRHEANPQLRRAARWTTAAAGAGALVSALSALTGPAPVTVAAGASTVAGTTGLVDQVQLLVANRTGHWLTPRFAVSDSGVLGSFWPVVHGPARLAPHQRATVVVAAPDTASMPAADAPFVVDTFITAPAAVTATRVAAPAPWRVVLEPSVIAKPVPVGRPLTLTAQLTAPSGAPLHDRLKVALTQTSFGAAGTLPGTAAVNGAAEGASPVTVETDAEGTARFVVRGDQPSVGPVFFEAWVLRRNGQPVDPSAVVSVRFTAR